MNDVLTLGALVALLLVVAAAAWTALTLTWARVPQLAGVPTTLGLYETAYLNGGARRTINTALVSLVAKGGVHVARDGTVTPVSGFSDRSDPIEAAVYQQVKRSRQGRSAAQVRHAVARHAAMNKLADRLQGAGLAKRPQEMRRAALPLRWLKLFTALALIVAVVAAIPMPSVLPRALLMAGIATVAGVACVLLFGRLNQRLAVAGAPTRRVALPGPAAPVALHGLKRLPDRELSEALRKDTRVRSAGKRRVGGSSSHVATCCAPGSCGSYPTMTYPHDGGAGGGFFGGWFGGSDGGSGGSGDGGSGGSGGGCGGGGGGGGD